MDLDPKNLKMKVRLADLYNKEGLKERAAGIYLEVAESLAMEQMHGEASQILERAKAMISTPQVFLTQSRLGVIQGDYGTAAEHLREGLGANPRNPELLEALAEIELRSGHPDRALEALAEVAQLPEKSLPLCERALRNLVNADRSDEGLRLFAPIARELARRGSGDPVSRCLHAALQDHLGSEAWLLLAEVAHQSGNRTDQVQALQSAYGLAHQNHDQSLAGSVATQLQALGVVPDAVRQPQVQEDFGTQVLGFDGRPRREVTRHGRETEVDPIQRLRIEQFSREAEAMLRSGSPERAIETYKKALELDPEDLTLIEAIAMVHRSTGRLTQVQMQYVQSAQALANVGKKREAAHLLDMAEQLFPGSTRIHRRSMGLPEAVPLHAAPPPPVQPLPDEGESPIKLDLPSAAPFSPPEAIALGDGQVELPDLGVLLPDPFSAPGHPEAVPLPESTAIDVPDLDWMGASLSEDTAPGFIYDLPASPTAPLPPMPTRQLEPEVVAALSALPEPEAVAPVEPVAISEELESLLGDIDFQLDYGSPEEAKIELEAALRQFPGHPELEARIQRAELALQKLGHAAKAGALEESDFANSFFDLTDVLGTALMDSGEGEEMHDTTSMVEKVQTVDELFSAFREGVEKQVQGDDYDTHYNLGIAYKEMQLIEPSIEEFKIAMGDPERTLECCSMLSICEQARGELDAAVEWLRKGILAPGFPPEDSIGLRYDLAEIYLQQGHPDMAAQEFRAVNDLDPDYRDVAARLA